MTPVRLEPSAPWSRVKLSTTKPLLSIDGMVAKISILMFQTYVNAYS